MPSGGCLLSANKTKIKMQRRSELDRSFHGRKAGRREGRKLSVRATGPGTDRLRTPPTPRCRPHFVSHADHKAAPAPWRFSLTLSNDLLVGVGDLSQHLVALRRNLERVTRAAGLPHRVVHALKR